SSTRGNGDRAWGNLKVKSKKLEVRSTGGAWSSGQHANPEIPEGDGILLILKADVSLRKSGIVHVHGRLAVQHDDQVIAARGDQQQIPLICLEGEISGCLGRVHDGAGVVAGRLLLPDLHFVAVAHEHAAVG